MFNRKKKAIEPEKEDIKELALKYRKILSKAKTLPPNSVKMFKIIRKAGI